MKKTLIAMIAAAFCVSSAMAQVLVYDYAASFKRIDVTQKTLKNGSKKTHYDSPKVASDKFTGYMVIDACEQCGGEMLKSTADDNAAVFYITRKGDKSKSNVYRAVGTFNANMFGANAAWLNDKYVFADKTKFTDASGFLAFPFSWGQILNSGFLGWKLVEIKDKCVVAENVDSGEVKEFPADTVLMAVGLKPRRQVARQFEHPRWEPRRPRSTSCSSR